MSSPPASSSPPPSSSSPPPTTPSSSSPPPTTCTSPSPASPSSRRVVSSPLPPPPDVAAPCDVDDVEVEVDVAAAPPPKGASAGSKKGGKASKATLHSVCALIRSEKADLEECISRDNKLRSELQQQVVVSSKRNEILDSAVKRFDNKIKMYLNQRIANEELQASSKMLEQETELKITPELADVLQRYGNFLFFVQRDTAYLTRLLAENPSNLDKLVQVVVFTLYGSRYDKQQTHLLLQLIVRTVTPIFEACTDITTFLRSNSAASKLMSRFTRRDECQEALQAALREPMLEVRRHPDRNLEINPRNILANMLSAGKEMEADSPIIAGLVKERVLELQVVVRQFLDSIIAVDLPFGMRIIAKMLRELADSRFPDNPSIGDSLIGGFIFLRFFSAAIVNPMTLGPGTPKARPHPKRTYVLVAKVLQNISNGSPFKESYMKPLDGFVAEESVRVREYFRRTTAVQPLQDCLEVDRILDEFSVDVPFLYTSLAEVIFLHDVFVEFIDNVAPNPDDPLRHVLQSLEEHDARRECKSHSDKYVTLRLADWMTGRDSGAFSAHADPRQAGTNAEMAEHMSASVMPLLRSIAQLNGVDMVALAEQAVAKPGADALAQLEAFFASLNANANVSGNASICSQLDKVRAKLREVVGADREQALSVVQRMFSRMADDLRRRHLLQLRLSDEVERLRSAVETVRLDHAALQDQIKTFQTYLDNVRQQTKYNPNLNRTSASASMSMDVATVSSLSEIDLNSVLSTQGLIGGLLSKVVRDVANRLMRVLHDGQHDPTRTWEIESLFDEHFVNPSEASSIFTDNANDASTPSADGGSGDAAKADDDSAEAGAAASASAGGDSTHSRARTRLGANASGAVFFPRTCEFYDASLATFATVGRCCLQDMVSIILRSLPSLSAAAATRTKGAEFSWASFNQLVPNLSASPKHSDVQELIIEIMAVDILVSVLQHYDPLKTPLSQRLVNHLTKLAFMHFDNVSRAPRPKGLKKSTYARARRNLADQWAIVLGQLSPEHVEQSVKRYCDSVDMILAAPKSEPHIFALPANGCRYLRFNVTTEHAADTLAKFLGANLRMLQNLKSSSSNGQTLLKAQLHTLELCLRSLDFTDVERSSSSGDGAAAAATSAPASEAEADPSGSGDAAASRLSHIFYDFVGPIYYELVKLYKIDDLKVHVLRVCSTIITHAPRDFFESAAETFVSDMLCKGIDRRSQNKTQRMLCVLHFLRGGYCQAEQPGVYMYRDQLIRRDDQVFGFAKRRLTEKVLDIIFRKVFERKQVAKQPEMMRISERTIVQMAFHNFGMTTSTILPFFFDSKDTQEQLVGLRALEILIDRRSGFAAFAIRHTDGEARRNRLEHSILALASTLLPTVFGMVKNSDNAVGLRRFDISRRFMPARGAHDLAASTRASRADPVLERWLSLSIYDLREESLGSTADVCFQDEPDRQVQQHLQVYYHALRLFPQIMPEQLLDPTPSNCSIDGLFVGKLLVHRHKLIARNAYAGLQRTLVSYADERGQVVESLCNLLCDAGFQHSGPLATLLSHTNALIKLWCNLLIERHNRRRPVRRASTKFISSSVEVDLPEISVIGPQSRVRNGAASSSPDATAAALSVSTPSFLRWMSLADAVGMIYCVHPSETVRLESLSLLRAVQHIYSVWHKTATDVKRPTPSPLDVATLRCVADIIDVYNEEIMRGGVQQFNSFVLRGSANSLSMGSGMGSQAANSQHISSFSTMLRNYVQLIPHCVATLGRLSVEISPARTLDAARSILLQRLGELRRSKDYSVPQDVQQDNKHPTEERMRVMWTNFNALFFAVSGVGRAHANNYRLPSILVTETVEEDMVVEEDDEDDDNNDNEISVSQQSASSVSSSEVSRSLRKRTSIATATGAPSLSAIEVAKRLEPITEALRGYLDEYWDYLSSEVPWVRDSLVLAIAEVHADSIVTVIEHLHEYYALTQKSNKKRSKRVLTLLTIIMHTLPLSIEFTHGLRGTASYRILEVYKTFLTRTHDQLWDPKKLIKDKWQGTQVDLVMVLASLARALNVLGDERDLTQRERAMWDENGNIREWSLEERFAMMTWVLEFSRQTRRDAANEIAAGTTAAARRSSAPDAGPTSSANDPAQYRATLVTHVTSQALQHLASLGQLIPDREVPRVLLAGDTLMELIQMQQGRHNLLAVLLFFHYKFLLPVYIDKIYQETDEATTEVYFRAIAEVLSSRDTGLLTNVSTDHQKVLPSRLGKQRRRGDLIQVSKSNLGKLVHLTLLLMASDSLLTRFAAFEMMCSVAGEFISSALAHDLEQYRFAFESPIPTWAKENAVAVSAAVARAVPELSFSVFREASHCLRCKPQLRFWIPQFLLPWASNIQLTPTGVVESRRKQRQYNEQLEREQQQQREQQESEEPAQDEDTEVTAGKSSTVRFAEPEKDDEDDEAKLDDDDDESRRMVVMSIHESLVFLVQVFNLSVEDIVPLAQMMPIWKTLASSQTNVAAIMQFLVSKVDDKSTDAPVELGKSIFFTLYTQPEHRDFMILTITRYFLKVLRKNAGQWSKTNLKNRLRSSKILSLLERHDDEGRGPNDTAAYDFAEYDFDELDESSNAASTNLPEATRARSVFVGAAPVAGDGAQASDTAPAGEGPVPNLAIRSSMQATDGNDTPRRGRTHTMQDVQHQREVTDIMVQQLQSHVVAAMLVELIGVDSKPVLPYFPVIVVYCIINLNDTDAFVRKTMHQLLIRLICSMSADQGDGRPGVTFSAHGEDAPDDVGNEFTLPGYTAEELRLSTTIASRHMGHSGVRRSVLATGFRGPVLSEAMQSESLQLIWNASEFAKVVSGPKSVVMFAESFVAQFCARLERIRPRSANRIGYEALRWAMLSTDLTISNQAYTIYRSLLTPLNASSIHALMLSLLGALEDWDRQGWYAQQGAGGSGGASSPSASTQHRHMLRLGQRGGAASKSNAGAEATMILDTIGRVAQQLHERGDLWKHPAVMWTGVALLRCDRSAVYERALELMRWMEGYPFLFTFVRKTDRYNDDDVGVDDVPDELGAASDAGLDSDVDGAGGAARQDPAELMPDDFWTYSDRWNPLFQGIQPYVLEGLMSPRSEPAALALMSSLTRVVWDPIVDSLPTRHLITVLSFLPYVYASMAGQHPSMVGNSDAASSYSSSSGGARLPNLRTVLTDLASVVERFSPDLSSCFAEFARAWHMASSTTRKASYGGLSGKRLADSFVTRVCKLLADLYFPQYAYPCAEYLLAVLHSEFTVYHPVALKITKVFLEHQEADSFVNYFAEIISFAHQAVTDQGQAQAKGGAGADAATVAGIIAHGSQQSGKDPQYHIRLARPASDAIAAAILLFNRTEEDGGARKDRSQADVLTLRALPIRSLRTAADALAQVIACAPMFAKD